MTYGVVGNIECFRAVIAGSSPGHAFCFSIFQRKGKYMGKLDYVIIT